MLDAFGPTPARHFAAAYEFYDRNRVVFRARAAVDLAEALTQLGRVDEASDALEPVRDLIAEQGYTTLAARVAVLALPTHV